MIPDENFLPSDTRLREDVNLCRNGNFDESQSTKSELEYELKRDRKLKAKYQQ